MGRQLMMTTWVDDFQRIQLDRAVFGGEMVYKGFPTESRNGHALQTGAGLAITSRASDPDGAWAFLRTILTEDWQRENVQWGFPTNMNVFNEMKERAMTPVGFITDDDGNEVEISNWGSGWGSVVVNIYAATQEDVDQIMELIDSVIGTSGNNESLMNIITEGAADFFAGRRTAQDAARVIQSRASIFIAEQT
jgi:ABC-type glycerol-3-phosphate transport system substrate-binding protein